MARIPQDLVDRIINDSDIVAIVNEHVPLKKLGANFKACCPFHNESTPSFVVSPTKQIFHCFGCGVGGNALSFLMSYNKMNFIDGIKFLAERLGINLPADSKNVEASNFEERFKDFYRVNSYAEWYFQNQLKKSNTALDYLKSRGIDPQTAEKFRLGYAAVDRTGLTTFLKSRSVPLKMAETLGLLKEPQKNPYDFFRERLMFPIADKKQRVIGFGGRDLTGNSQAKYINSPESPIYHKSRELYGFNLALKPISQKSQAIVVEGYIDVIACHQLGFDNAVAPLGTSLTADHIKLLSRYAQNLILLFDADPAGIKASEKSILLCFELGIHPKIAFLVGAKDPGEVLVQNQTHVLKNAVEQAKPAIDWLCAQVLKDPDNSPTGNAKKSKIISSYIKMLPDIYEQNEFTKKYLQFVDLENNAIHSKSQKTIDFTMESTRKSPSANFDKTESTLVALGFMRPDLLPVKFLQELVADFADKTSIELVNFLQDFTSNQATFNVQSAINTLAVSSSPNLAARVSGFLMADFSKMNQNLCKLLVLKFRESSLRRKLKDITAAMLEAELRRNEEDLQRLLIKKQEFLKELDLIVKQRQAQNNEFNPTNAA